MRVKVLLDTGKRIQDFVALATAQKGEIRLTDDTHNFIVSGKSLLGAMYTTEWSDGVWMEADDDSLRSVFKDFIGE